MSLNVRSFSFSLSFAGPGLALFALALAVTVGGSAACTDDGDSCEAIQRGLATCGIASRDIDCTRIDRGDRESLAKSFESGGCPSLATDNEGDVDPRVCKLGGWSCPDSPLPASDAAKSTTQYPLVFVSGIDGTPTFDWNPRIIAALREANGDAPAFETEVVHVLPWATTAQRTQDLFDSLDHLATLRGWSKTNLICYAVGGIDCRFLVSPGGLFQDDPTSLARAQSLVASITTVSTPHRGTHVADAALEALGNGDAAAIFAALSGTGDVPTSLDHGALATTLQGLTPTALNRFNQTVTDADGISYQSFAGVSRVLGKSANDDDANRHCQDESGTTRFFHHPGTEDASGELLWLTTPFAGATIGDDGATVVSPSDGMVSVESAKWGTFRGCIPADHYDVIGQIGHATRDVQTGFEPVDFYRWIALDLATRGM